MLRNFAEEFTSHNIPSLMRNVRTKMEWQKIKNKNIPVSINETDLECSYVVSPYSALVLYSREELVKLPRFFKVLELILGPIGFLLRSIQINKMVAINNWLLSTNIYPQVENNDFLEIGDKYKASHPDHFIIFRSLNKKTNASLIKDLLKRGYTLIPSRQVYLFDCQSDEVFKRQSTKHDMRLLRKNKYKVVSADDFSDEDYQRAEELYGLLYLEKYSKLNPDFTAKYMKLCQQSGTMKIKGFFSAEGVMEGVIGYFIIDKIMSVPIVGYNTRLPQSSGLYRQLMVTALLDAKAQDLFLNLSSGASAFKLFRGGRPYTEYSAVRLDGLSWWRKLGFRFIQVLLYCIALPLLKLFKL